MALYTYTDLVAYWQCPRQAHYRLAGWRSPAVDFKMVRGQLTHAMIAGHYSGEGSTQVRDILVELGSDAALLPAPADALAALGQARKEAQGLAHRYLDRYGDAPSIRATEVELRCPSSNGHFIGGHADWIGELNGAKVVGEIKTTEVPNLRLLDMAGQADYYAVLADAPYICIDLVTPEYVTRHLRPTNQQVGTYMIDQLNSVVEALPYISMLNTPRMGYWCSRCPFLSPCIARQGGHDDDDILLQDYIRNEPRDSTTSREVFGQPPKGDPL